MAGPVDVIMTDKWSIGYAHDQQLTILMFQFADRPPINVAISRSNAEQIAKAILEQYKNPPPRKVS